jgi:hypothetical protein
MLLPWASVTLIGVLAGLIAFVSGRRSAGYAFGRGVLGAWIGFVLGALVGVTIDIVTHNGYFLAIFGHLAAIAGAAWAVGTRRTLALGSGFREDQSEPRSRARG